MEEDGPAPFKMNAHPEPLTLLALVKSIHAGLLQLRNPQGAALFSFVHVPSRVPCHFASAAACGMSLTHTDQSGCACWDAGSRASARGCCRRALDATLGGIQFGALATK